MGATPTPSGAGWRRASRHPNRSAACSTGDRTPARLGRRWHRAALHRHDRRRGRQVGAGDPAGGHRQPPRPHARHPAERTRGGGHRPAWSAAANRHRRHQWRGVRGHGRDGFRRTDDPGRRRRQRSTRPAVSYRRRCQEPRPARRSGQRSGSTVRSGSRVRPCVSSWATWAASSAASMSSRTLAATTAWSTWVSSPHSAGPTGCVSVCARCSAGSSRRRSCRSRRRQR